MATVALTELLGVPVFDASGKPSGRVREVALAPGEDRTRVAMLIVKTKHGDRTLPFTSIASIDGGIRAVNSASEWSPTDGAEGLLLLERDLLDQQVIDVYGRKVVRVNDVDLHQESAGNRTVLKIASVDVGARGAVRRLLKGIVPAAALNVLLRKIPPKTIPWEFVDLIETDPARRVKLKISHERLAKLHPADIADIVEDLAPDERAAEIVEEMEPDAAADLLADLPQDRTEEILVQMEPEERQEVTELLEFKENTAAGRRTTEYLALPLNATVHDAIETLRNFEGGVETVSTIYLLDEKGRLAGAVPLAKLVMAEQNTPLLSLKQEPLISCHAGAGEKEVAELFDKYNLLTLPVVDDDGKLTGVITSDDVISLLRAKL